MNKECKDTVTSILDKDDIVNMSDTLISKAEQPRCGLFVIVNDKGGYSLDAVGRVSHLEWLGLATLLSDYCKERAEICYEEGIVEEGGIKDASED